MEFDGKILKNLGVSTYYIEENGLFYPCDSNGDKYDEDIKFPDLESLKDVYGENVKRF